MSRSAAVVQAARHASAAAQSRHTADARRIHRPRRHRRTAALAAPLTLSRPRKATASVPTLPKSLTPLDSQPVP